MSIEGKFSLRVGGQVRSRALAQSFKMMLDQRVKLIDPEIKITEKDFGGFLYVFTWEGVPKHMEEAQSLLGYLKRSMGGFFIVWKFIIKINFIESEEY